MSLTEPQRDYVSAVYNEKGRPFTTNSLKDIFLIYGFDNVKVEKFRQLPFLWSITLVGAFLFTCSVHNASVLRFYSKFVRFSQEIILISIAVIPKE